MVPYSCGGLSGRFNLTWSPTSHTTAGDNIGYERYKINIKFIFLLQKLAPVEGNTYYQ